MENLVDQDLSEIRYSPTGTYKRSFIRSVVSALEQGASKRELGARYKISPKTLLNWMEKYGDPALVCTKPKTFTAAERRSTARAVLAGELSVKAAAKAQGVSITAVRRWLLVEKSELSGSNSDNLKKTKKPPPTATSDAVDDERLKRLQEELAYAHLRIKALNTLIDVAEEQLHINIRKKPGAKQS